jgi:hypothetical protein
MCPDDEDSVGAPLKCPHHIEEGFAVEGCLCGKVESIEQNRGNAESVKLSLDVGGRGVAAGGEFHAARMPPRRRKSLHMAGKGIDIDRIGQAPLVLRLQGKGEAH